MGVWEWGLGSEGQFVVIALVEMSRHFSLLWFMGDLVEVRLEPLFDTVFCLAYILFPARGTGDAIHNVIAVFSGMVCPKYRFQ